MSNSVRPRAFPRLVLALSLTGLLPAQEPTQAVAEAYQAFCAAAGGQWNVRWHAPTGTPRVLFGQGLALEDWRTNSLEEARRHAHLALGRYAALLGLGDSEYRETIGAQMGRTWTFKFAQYWRGLPVIGGRVDVRIHMRGRLCHLGSTAWNVPPALDPVPRLGEDAAVARAWLSRQITPNEVPQPGTPRRPRLVLWGDGTAPSLAPVHLCWEVPISAVEADGDGPIGRVYVDAHDGRVLHYTDDKHACGIPGCVGHVPTPPPPATYTVMAWLHTGFSPVSAPTNEPLAGVEVVVPGQGTLITDANGQFSVDLAAPTQVTVRLDGVHCRRVVGTDALAATLTLQPGQGQTFQLGAATSTQNELAHTTCYYWVYQVNELMRSLLGSSPQLDLADQVQPTVNIQSSCNAYYTGNSINFYHAAGSCNNTASASVIAHEWGHGIDDRYGGISQINGLSEGWGDICSMYLLDDPVIGHGFYVGSSGGIRTGNNTRQFPSGSSVHAMGQTWMGFAWKFRQNLRALVGPSQAILLSNEIVLASLAADAENQPDAVIAAFEAADDDGNLTNGTPWYAELVAACNAHSLPYPQLQDGYLANPTILTATTDQLVPRFVELDAVANNGAFAQVRVHYDDGQLRQRPMVPLGTGDRYRALLPGMLAPRPLSYHFEAQHGGGVTYRMPASGEYTYVTLTDQVIWREDFESGGAGWTHGASAGTDDWEIAAPVGAAGANWCDPGAAASGSLCAGTDLTGNGAYSPSSASWLRSPVIDCSGHANLWLRCRRWASCDLGSLDALTIRVNGFPAYQSYYPIDERGWTTFEIPLPFTNNNPAVVIEFGLVSDSSYERGGWQIDDLEVYSATGTQPPPTALTLLPEQAQQGTPLQLSIRTPSSQPFLWALGATAGPTLVQGIPPILVGGSFVTFFDYTDQNGDFGLSVTAPPAAAAGLVWHSQVLTLDANGAFVTSNPFVNLFTF